MIELTNILVPGSAIVIVIILWSIVGVRHLKTLRLRINEKWEELDESLRKRQNLIPLLVERVRLYDKNQEIIFGQLIEERMRAAKEYHCGAKKIEYEHDLSRTIYKVLDFGKIIPELNKDTNFLEIKSNFGDIGVILEEKSSQYNEAVRNYNKQKKSVFLLPLAKIFKYKSANIFEVEI